MNDASRNGNRILRFNKREPREKLHGICEEVGRTLARHGHVVMTGGRDGVMELVSRAVSKEGDVLLVCSRRR